MLICIISSASFKHAFTSIIIVKIKLFLLVVICLHGGCVNAVLHIAVSIIANVAIMSE